MALYKHEILFCTFKHHCNKTRWKHPPRAGPPSQWPNRSVEKGRTPQLASAVTTQPRESFFLYEVVVASDCSKWFILTIACRSLLFVNGRYLECHIFHMLLTNFPLFCRNYYDFFCDFSAPVVSLICEYTYWQFRCLKVDVHFKWII